MRQRLTAGSEAGVAATYEVTIATKQARPVVLELSTRTLLNQGEVVGIQGIARDISERRNLELQLHQAQKMESVGQLAAGVAHDFNNLLTVILGHGNLLTSEACTQAEVRDSSQQIVGAAQRAADLTRQLLAFSRKQIMQRRSLELNGVVSNMARMLPPLARGNTSIFGSSTGVRCRRSTRTRA